MGEFIFGAATISISSTRADGADAAQGPGGREQYGRRRRAHSVRRHQTSGAGRHRRGRQEIGAVLRQFALARRHPDQLEDDLGSIKRLRKLDEILNSGEAQGYTKKERLTLTRERDKLNRALGGIKDMGGLPDLLFVIDTNKEDIAIKEAKRLNIPVAALSTPIAIRRALRSWCPATTMPGVRSRSIAISSPRLRSTVSRVRRAKWASTWARPLPLSWKTCRRKRPTPGLASRAVGSARRCRRSQETARCVAGHREEAQRLGIFHFWQIAAFGPDAAHKVGEEVGLPGRVDGWIAEAKALGAEAE